MEVEEVDEAVEAFAVEVGLEELIWDQVGLEHQNDEEALGGSSEDAAIGLGQGEIAVRCFQEVKGPLRKQEGLELTEAVASSSVEEVQKEVHRQT